MISHSAAYLSSVLSLVETEISSTFPDCLSSMISQDELLSLRPSRLPESSDFSANELSYLQLNERHKLSFACHQLTKIIEIMLAEHEISKAMKESYIAGTSIFERTR